MSDDCECKNGHPLRLDDSGLPRFYSRNPRLFDQKHEWVGRDGRAHEISNMGPRYRANVRSFLIKRAQLVVTKFQRSKRKRLPRFRLVDPEKMVRKTKLFRALERADK